MTRKDYNLIADAIKNTRLPVSLTDERFYLMMLAATRTIAESVADGLAGDNPRFDRERFLKAALGEKFDPEVDPWEFTWGQD